MTILKYDRDPFRRGDNILVMCETLCPDGSPHPTNHRFGCKEKMDKASAHRPWFGIEQVSFHRVSDYSCFYCILINRLGEFELIFVSLLEFLKFS